MNKGILLGFVVFVVLGGVYADDVPELAEVSGETVEDISDTDGEPKGQDNDWNYWSSAPNMYAIPTGNVGIGTNQPKNKVEIKGSSSSSEARLNLIGYWNPEIFLTTRFEQADGKIHFRLKDSDRFVVFYDGSENKLKVSGAQAELAALTNAGYFGIGVSNPAECLDVAGTVKSTGFVMPTGASQGFVLTSDSEGKGTWQPVEQSTTAVGRWVHSPTRQGPGPYIWDMQDFNIDPSTFAWEQGQEFITIQKEGYYEVFVNVVVSDLSDVERTEVELRRNTGSVQNSLGYGVRNATSGLTYYDHQFSTITWYQPGDQLSVHSVTPGTNRYGNMFWSTLAVHKISDII